MKQINILQQLIQGQSKRDYSGLWGAVNILFCQESDAYENLHMMGQHRHDLLAYGNLWNYTGNIDDLLQIRNHMAKAFPSALSLEHNGNYNSLAQQLRHNLFCNCLPGNSQTKTGYKHNENIILSCDGSHVSTCPVNQVPSMMEQLNDWLMLQKTTDLNTLAEYHIRFEKIHPFEDGNGRVGRLITFRQCLDYGIFPFVFYHTEDKQYYQALQQNDAVALGNLFAEWQRVFAQNYGNYFI